ncbi:UDP-N-acetylglucosamine 2-epimerase [Lutibacter maritimus]|uniref:CDP-glycerol glycerophosphotransferase, TagB/SpsB family n=1 Tax=Lutibacter maritimus TaxID=593133 RepID=A0A1I6NPG0_9FLAO|nr:UDP-N-acetylglucosamine 2-epimerase [Lutibacter maritimus]SFS29779.1 CDP-glycerol glycerophosphotransferase, TagB/SpsB family [Lutibacter maritimus]
MNFLLYISYDYGFPIVQPLEEEILKRGHTVAWFLEFEESKKKLKSNQKILNTVVEVIAYNPDAVLVASNEVPHFFPGIKVQLFHGFSVNKRSENKGHFRIRGFFDLYCTQGPSTTNRFKELEKKHKHFKVVETGWSKVDILFPVNENNSNHTPTIFFASTFTERLSIAHDNQVFKELVKLIESENWNWIINLHPKMNSEIVKKFQELEKFENVTYIPFLENLEPLKRADVMLTDTSSIITEFIIQKKPVITFKNNQPKECFINVLNVDDLKKSIEFALTYPTELMHKIASFVKEEHPYADGKSSKRVIDTVEEFVNENQKNQLKPKPFNIIRKLKIRKKFGFFNFFKNSL